MFYFGMQHDFQLSYEASLIRGHGCTLKEIGSGPFWVEVSTEWRCPATDAFLGYAPFERRWYETLEQADAFLEGADHDGDYHYRVCPELIRWHYDQVVIRRQLEQVTTKPSDDYSF